VLCDGSFVQAGRQQKEPSATEQDDAERGRAVFNGKGVCYYCHGVDGHIDKRPQLNAGTAALIARLNPPPADLRNSNSLHLKNDKQRGKAIREGHPGTGMFPDTTMTDQDLANTLAYLALLRNQVAEDADKHRSNENAGRPSTGDSTRGEGLYTASCIVCHGSGAMGGLGPRLANNPVLSNEQTFWRIVYKGQHVMPPLKDAITEQQMADIQAWLKTLW